MKKKPYEHMLDDFQFMEHRMMQAERKNSITCPSCKEGVTFVIDNKCINCIQTDAYIRGWRACRRQIMGDKDWLA